MYVTLLHKIFTKFSFLIFGEILICLIFAKLKHYCSLQTSVPITAEDT